MFAAMKSTKLRWIAIGVVGGCALIFAVLGESWRTLDRHWPRLNEYLHSGTPTTRADLEYRLARFLADAKRLDTLCVSDPSTIHNENDAIGAFKNCRKQTLASKPVLEDMHAHYGQLKAIWEKETAERPVPAGCKNSLNQILTNVDAYMSVWDREFSLLESINPDTAKPEELGKTARQMSALELEAVAALDGLNKVDPKAASDACKGY